MSSSRISRREFIKWTAAGAGATAMSGCASMGGSAGRVVVVGGGYGGATAAKFIKLWAPDIDVTLVEPNQHFISCPISNLVLGGNAQMGDITFSYEGLRSRGIRVVRDSAVAIDAEKRQVRLAGGDSLGYDRVIVSPGIEFMFDQIPALKSTDGQNRILHAWKAGAQTVALRNQLVAMRDGACTCCRFRWRRIAARRDRTSASARSPTI